MIPAGNGATRVNRRLSPKALIGGLLFARLEPHTSPTVPSTDFPCSITHIDGKRSEKTGGSKPFGLSLLPVHLSNRVVHSGVFLGTVLRTFEGVKEALVAAMTLKKASAP